MSFEFRRSIVSKKKKNNSRDLVSIRKIATIPRSWLRSLHRAFLSENDDSPVETVLANQDVLAQIIDFVPARNQLLSCKPVSKAWHKTISERIPLRLRIEDRGKKQIWFFRPSWNIRKDGRSDRNEILYPFYKIESLPAKVRQRVTQLTLVMRTIPEHMDKYNLESMIDILQDFYNLEDLRVLSELGEGDFFCGLFQSKNYLQRLRTLRIIGYNLDYGIRNLVMTAPNLEHLEITSRAGGCDLNDLLPLYKTLRAFRICTYARLNGYDPIYRQYFCFGGDVDNFVKSMPLLRSWEFLVGGNFVFGAYPARHNTDCLSSEELSLAYGKDNPKFLSVLLSEQFFSALHFYELFVNWFIGLKEKDKDRWDIEHLVNVGRFAYLHTLIPTRRNPFTIENIGNATAHKEIRHAMAIFKIAANWPVIYRNPHPWNPNSMDLVLNRFWHPLHKFRCRKMRRKIYRIQKHSKYVPFDEIKSGYDRKTSHWGSESMFGKAGTIPALLRCHESS